MPSPEPIWILLGARHGDNQQLLAIGAALGVPVRAIPLRFNRAARLRFMQFFAVPLTWRTAEPLAPPWPRVVLAAGRKSVPAALWIGRRSAGRTRLVHVNRPWAPLAWFDLIITTPQYALPERPNVLSNLLPFLPPAVPPTSADLARPALPTAWSTRAAALPRPWTVVLVGGKSRPYVLDDAAAARLADTVNAEVRQAGGSAWVLGSPRTPAAALATIERALAVPAQVVRWGGFDDNPYPALRSLADRFIVTADSASMLAEALATGRPVTPLALPARPDWRWRFAAAWRTAAERAPASLAARVYAAALGLGLLSSVRDMGRLQQALDAAGVFVDGQRAVDLAERERGATLARIAALLDRPAER